MVSPLAAEWEAARRKSEVAMEELALHHWIGALWEFVGAANRFVDTEKPWELAKAAKGGDETARKQLADVLGDLLEACRLVALYAAPVIPETAEKIWALLGHPWPFDAAGRSSLTRAALGSWGSVAATGALGEPVPLFPRLEADEQPTSAD
jgi:methionyl-tRNA synthetase